MVALGNSTDHLASLILGEAQPSENAWPALVEEMLLAQHPELEVTVVNESVSGAGFDTGVFMAPSMQDRLAEIAARPGDHSRAILALAPSVVDLQLRDDDAERSFEAFDALLDTARQMYPVVVVAPMNPVGRGYDEALSDAIANFNALLDGSGLLDDTYPSSALLEPEGRYGAYEFFDDFDDYRRDSAGPDPDLLHPDADGHRALAAAITPWLAEVVTAACRD